LFSPEVLIEISAASTQATLKNMSVSIRSATCVLVADISMPTQGKLENKATTRRIAY
jgi:hypothetical protein